MTHNTSLILALLLLVGAVSAAWAQPAATDNGFYDRKAEGWFWYDDPPEEQQPEEPEEKPEPKVVVAPQEPKPTPEPVDQGPAVFSAAWFRENLPKYKDRAWNNPTLENLQAFMYLQRYTIDRSEQFADMAQLAVIGDPYLDELSRRSGATYASQKLDRMAGDNRRALLKKLANRVGIFFFFQAGQSLSALQAPLIKRLQENSGFAVVPISADGQRLQAHLFANVRTDTGHAKKMGVVSYPAVFLIAPDGQFAAVGQGVMALPGLQRRIILAAKRSGWITEAEFNGTRPVRNANTNIAEHIDIGDMTRPNQQRQPNTTNFVPPSQIVQFMKEQQRE